MFRVFRHFTCGIFSQKGGLPPNIGETRETTLVMLTHRHRYELCLERLGVRGAALVAHHEDDADENRLAELGKGRSPVENTESLELHKSQLHHPETQGINRNVRSRGPAGSYPAFFFLTAARSDVSINEQY